MIVDIGSVTSLTPAAPNRTEASGTANSPGAMWAYWPGNSNGLWHAAIFVAAIYDGWISDPGRRHTARRRIWDRDARLETPTTGNMRGRSPMREFVVKPTSPSLITDREAVHHLPRDAELLLGLPERIRIHRIIVDRQGAR